jgi:serine phosphatase RsbU (regulator of sigma subunit)
MPPATLTYSNEAGRHTKPLEAASTSLGRSPAQDVVLADPCISRQHALILREGAAFTLVDQNSTHGTYLNGTRTQRAPLKSGDLIQLGSLNGPRLQFQQPRGSAGQSSGISSSDLLTSLISFPQDTREFASGTLSGGRSGARSMEQLNWLLSAARRLNESGAIADTLDALLQLTLQLTGLERGFVFTESAGEMQLARGLNAAGDILDEDSTVSRTAIRLALASRSRFSVSDTLADEAASEWESVLANSIRSIYCIPLRKHVVTADPRESGELLGLLYLDSQIRPGHLTEVDHQLLEAIATEAAALLHNALLAQAELRARKEREELAVAARIHSGLMSVALPTLPYATLQARTIPCLSIGGDFFDAVALDDCLCATVADVSGKGVSAAIVAATLQGILHSQFLAGQGLPEIAALVNRFLCTRNVGKYATMVMLRLFPDGRLEYLNCGHIQPLVIRGEEVRQLQQSNLIVGLIGSATYHSGTDRLQPGERILLATDGVTEAENAQGDDFGDAGLCAVASVCDLDGILQRVAAFHAPNPAQDDCTLLQVVYQGNTQDAA